MIHVNVSYELLLYSVLITGVENMSTSDHGMHPIASVIHAKALRDVLLRRHGHRRRIVCRRPRITGIRVGDRVVHTFTRLMNSDRGASSARRRRRCLRLLLPACQHFLLLLLPLAPWLYIASDSAAG